MEAGRMPNLKALMDRGVHGKLRSLEPLAKSPAIWTTMATGKSPDEHGIGTFVDFDRGRPLTRNVRKVRAIWNILSGLDRRVGVVGWLMSWPAEPVNGVVITDYLQYGPGRSTRVEHRTYPPALESETADLVLEEDDIPWSFTQRFLSAPLDTVRMDRSLENALRPIKTYAAADLTFTRVAERLYREEPFDFFTVYLRGMDTMGHLFWNYMIPDSLPPGTVDERLLPWLAGAVREYYAFTDELVGRLVALADENTTVMVVSDHGFQGGLGRGVEAHKLDGVVILAGKSVGRGELTGASVYDVTPTALTLLGLPPARDMRGKVLWSALGPEIPRDRFAQILDTYETGETTGTAPLASPVDEEIKERLRSLGYLD
jgi:predicted AlkP superfamily phosphohydrolase/phosphomutase